jgi:hypothetical protein
MLRVRNSSSQGRFRGKKTILIVEDEGILAVQIFVCGEYVILAVSDTMA